MMKRALLRGGAFVGLALVAASLAVLQLSNDDGQQMESQVSRLPGSGLEPVPAHDGSGLTEYAGVRPADLTTIVFAAPVESQSEGQPEDAQLWLQSNMDEPLLIGRYITAQAVTSGTANIKIPQRLLAVGSNGTDDLFLEGDGVRVVGQREGSGRLPAALDSAGTFYGLEGGRVVGRDDGNNVLDSFAVPELEETLPAPDSAVYSYGGWYKHPTVAQLAFGADDQLFAAVYDWSDSGLFNLTSGAGIQFPGFGVIQALVFGPDGYFYLLLWNGDQGDESVVAKVSSDLELVAKIGTGIRPADGLINGISFLPSPAGSLYLYVAQSPGTTPNSDSASVQRGILYKVDQDASLNPIDVPENVGIYAAVGVDGNLYFFGGLAGPVVSMYDPASASFVGEIARSPDGSYVQAVFVR